MSCGKDDNLDLDGCHWCFYGVTCDDKNCECCNEIKNKKEPIRF